MLYIIKFPNIMYNLMHLYIIRPANVGGLAHQNPNKEVKSPAMLNARRLVMSILTGYLHSMTLDQMAYANLRPRNLPTKGNTIRLSASLICSMFSSHWRSASERSVEEVADADDIGFGCDK